MSVIDNTALDSELGKKVAYDNYYNPDRLFPIPRDKQRAEIGVSNNLPFFGADCWNHYEVSWLNEKGKPIVAIAEIIFDASSPYLIEGKSMKLYFNSLNNTKFADEKELTEIIQRDLESRVKATVSVKIFPLSQLSDGKLWASFSGKSIDDLDIACSHYTVDSSLLKTEDYYVEEILFSNLLRSNCLVTGQPDWGSIQIDYAGNKISHESLLRYIISFRNHSEFGEHCAERIFMDLVRECKPSRLTVHCRYTRRGGIDINCYRSTEKIKDAVLNPRLYRQ